VPSAPALITEPARRRGASDIPKASGSTASTIECPGMPSPSFAMPTAAAAPAPLASSTSSSSAETRWPARASDGTRAVAVSPS
jgi:hypothetical protein